MGESQIGLPTNFIAIPSKTRASLPVIILKPLESHISKQAQCPTQIQDDWTPYANLRRRNAKLEKKFNEAFCPQIFNSVSNSDSLSLLIVVFPEVNDAEEQVKGDKPGACGCALVALSHYSTCLQIV